MSYYLIRQAYHSEGWDCPFQSDPLHVQVALTGIRRRRGVEGLPETDAETKAALVSELLCLNDACGDILRRCVMLSGSTNSVWG